MIWLLAAPAFAVGGVAGWRFGFAAYQRLCLPWSIPGVGRRAAITFDDGPDPAGTPGVLDDLAAAGVRATFFMLGERVARHPALVQRIAEAGHEAEVHGWSHTNAAFLTRRKLVRDLRSARHAIEDACGRVPTLYRPAYGVLTPAAVRAAREVGLTPWLWTGWARDWRRLPPSAIHRALVRALSPGAVLVLHDGEQTGGEDGAVANMRRALQPFLAEAAWSGWRLGPLGSMTLVRTLVRPA